MAPSKVPAITPKPNPAPTRSKVAVIWRARSPVRASSTMVAKIRLGGGTSRLLDRPNRTISSHASDSPSGSNSPSAGRAQRPQPRRWRGRRHRVGRFERGQFDGHGHSKNASRPGLQDAECGRTCESPERLNSSCPNRFFITDRGDLRPIIRQSDRYHDPPSKLPC